MPKSISNQKIRATSSHRKLSKPKIITQERCKLTEEELISGLQALTEEAFHCLYDQCFHLCKNFILTNGGTQDDAKDFFQEAILVLLAEKKLNKFLAAKKAKVSTFLITIFRYMWFNHRRAGKKIKILDVEDTLKNHASEVLIEILTEPVSDLEKIAEECMKTMGDICQKVILMAIKTQTPTPHSPLQQRPLSPYSEHSPPDFHPLLPHPHPSSARSP